MGVAHLMKRVYKKRGKTIRGRRMKGWRNVEDFFVR